MVLGPEVYPEIPRKWRKVVPEGNDPFPHHDEFGFRKPTITDLCQMIKGRFDKSDIYLDSMSHFDQRDGKLDELTKETRTMDQRSAGLEHDA